MANKRQSSNTKGLLAYLCLLLTTAMLLYYFLLFLPWDAQAVRAVGENLLHSADLLRIVAPRSGNLGYGSGLG